MRTVHIQSEIQGFSSPAEAIQRGQNANADFLRQRSLERLFGKRVAIVQYDDQHFSATMEDGQELVVAASTGGVIDVQVAPTKPAVFSSPSEPIVLEMNGSSLGMDRRATANAIKGGRLRRASFNGQMLFLYFDGDVEIVLFHSVRNVDSEMSFLYWGESD